MLGDGRALRHRGPDGNFIPTPEHIRPSGAELKRLYVDERLSLGEVSERVQYSTQVVAQWLRDEGVTIRSQSSSPAEQGRPGLWRKVVGRVEKPYDRLPDGTVLSVPLDMLECGHTKPLNGPKTGVRRTGNAGQDSPPAKERRCKTCERIEETP